MPAPYRWVIGRPGVPGADDATDFSDWFYPADQTAPVASAIATTSDTGVPREEEGVALGGETTVEDPPPPEEPPGEIIEFAKAITTATGGAAGISGGSWNVIHATWNTKSGNPSGTDDDPFYLSHTLEGGRDAGAASVAPRPRDLLWSDDWRPEWPDGAIGYEVETVELAPDFWVPAADPVSAEFTVTLEPSVYGGAIFEGSLWARAVVNTLWGEGDPAWFYSGPLLDMTVHRSAPATLVAADDPGFGEVFVSVPEGEDVILSPAHVGSVTVTDFSHAPPRTGLVGFHTQVGGFPGSTDANPVPILNDGERVVVSANANISGTYVIRPPRIRWIFGTPQAITYRRTYPRDDALGGGAARTWPPSKAVQSSNRTFGGYL